LSAGGVLLHPQTARTPNKLNDRRRCPRPRSLRNKLVLFGRVLPWIFIVFLLGKYSVHRSRTQF
jgi:hypothetical protein